MSLFSRLFVQHPASVGETYGQHAGFACGTGLKLIGAGLACLVHAVLPFAFKTTGSTCIRELNANLTGRQQPQNASLARTVS